LVGWTKFLVQTLLNAGEVAGPLGLA